MSKVRKSILAFLLQSGVRFLDKWSRDRFIYFLYDLSIILSSFFRYLRTTSQSLFCSIPMLLINISI